MRNTRLLKPEFLIFLERFLLGLGVLGLVFVCLAYMDARLASSQAIAAFNAAVAEESDSNATSSFLTIDEPDQSLWSDTRKRKYIRINPDDLPLAVLEIERLKLQVPVFPGTDLITLNRGAGIVDGTAHPGEKGNIVVSAHRDGFFRSLKDIALGDRIELRTLQGTQVFLVKELFITDPLDVSVLDPTDSTTLTLITCYPFYFVGYAPERLIIRAEPVNAENDSQNNTLPALQQDTMTVAFLEVNPGKTTHGALDNPN